jgi:hypothetical protein
MLGQLAQGVGNKLARVIATDTTRKPEQQPRNMIYEIKITKTTAWLATPPPETPVKCC